MRVTLAAPYGQHEADSTIDVPEHVGKDLIRVGRARDVADNAPTRDAHGRFATTETTEAEEV